METSKSSLESDKKEKKKDISSFEEKNPHDPLVEVIFVDCSPYYKKKEKENLK